MSEWNPAVVDPIVAWRVWRVEEDERSGLLFLHSIHYGIRWPRRKPMRAHCIEQWRRGRMNPYPQAHQAPSGAGTHACGIYALKEMEGTNSWLATAGTNATKAIGRVSLWGRIALHEGGYRAEFAYPLDLLLLQPTPEGVDAEEVASLLADAYGVPARAGLPAYSRVSRSGV